MPGAAQVVSRFQLISLLGIHRNTHGVEFSSFWILSSPRSKSWSPEMYPIPGEQWILWNAQKMPLWGIAHPRSQILRFPPRSASDIYCQFWALFQNGPFSYLAAERLEFRRGNIFHFVVVQAKEYQGVATSKLVYNPDIRDDGRYLACRVLPTSKAGKSLEDTWEIKVLCESKSESFLKRQLLRFWIKKDWNQFCRQAPSIFAAGSLLGPWQPADRWPIIIS